MTQLMVLRISPPGKVRFMPTDPVWSGAEGCGAADGSRAPVVVFDPLEQPICWPARAAAIPATATSEACLIVDFLSKRILFCSSAERPSTQLGQKAHPSMQRRPC